MSPYYFTVTEGQLPVDIAVGTIKAAVYALNSNYTISNLSSPTTYLKVIESVDQLEAGIFGVTAPIANIAASSNAIVGDSNAGKAILGTSNYSLINTTATSPHYGYSYRITAKGRIGNFAISRIAAISTSQIKIFFDSTSDFLQFLFFVGGSGSSDKIITTGVSDSVLELANWNDDNVEYDVQATNSSDSSITINIPTSVSSAFSSGSEDYAVRKGTIRIVRDNYFIADGNVYVSD